MPSYSLRRPLVSKGAAESIFMICLTHQCCWRKQHFDIMTSSHLQLHRFSRQSDPPHHENSTQRLHCKPPSTAIFDLCLISPTQKTLVTLTHSHTPTTTVSQRTRRPTDKHLCQQTQTAPRRGHWENSPSTWVTFHLSRRLSVFLPVSHFPASVLTLCCCRNRTGYEKGDEIWWLICAFVVQQNWRVILLTSVMFSFFPAVFF